MTHSYKLLRETMMLLLTITLRFVKYHSYSEVKILMHSLPLSTYLELDSEGNLLLIFTILNGELTSKIDRRTAEQKLLMILSKCHITYL